MPKQNKYIIKVTEELYRANVRVFIGSNTDYYKYLSREFGINKVTDETRVDGCDGLYIKLAEEATQKEIHFIYLETADNLFTLSHELIHLVAAVLKDRGINVNLAYNDEVVAYFHTHLLEKIWNKIKELKKKKLHKRK